jgi:excisionase family DNA binding protein
MTHVGQTDFDQQRNLPMARRPNGPKKMPTDDSPSGTEGQTIARREKTTQAARNATRQKAGRNKQKRRNRLEELAETLNISRSTIYQLAKQGKIPCGKLGGRYAVPDDAEDRIKSLAHENWHGQARSIAPPHLGTSGSFPTGAAKRRRSANVWLSPRQFARRFGVGTGAVYGAVERGEVPAIRLGRHIRFPPDIVESILR